MTGCSQLGYYVHCTQGHLALLAGRTPIEKILSDPGSPEELSRQLLELSRIRDFASTELKLPDNGSYRSYSDLNRPFVTWNVVATKEFHLQPLQWCFPIAGCLPYQGFFERQRAESFALELQKKGYDTYLYGVSAYSTLGWFDDPVLNTFINRPPVDRAGIIFHELAHQQLFLPNDPDFSEGFATAVEQLGIEKWLKHNDSPEAIAAYKQRIQREEVFTLMLANLRQQLSDLYRQPVCPDCMRQNKSKLIASFISEYDQWEIAEGGDCGYGQWVSDQLNNAKLAVVNTYHQKVPGFRAIFAQQGNDFENFYRAVKEISELPEKQRAARLKLLEDTVHTPLP